MGQCASDVVPSRYEVLDTEPRAVSLERIKSLSSNAIVPAAHMQEIQEGRKLADDFDFPGEVLGHGLCGDVVMARGKLDQGCYAMKTLGKEGQTVTKVKQMTEEVEIYVALSHPNIAKLHGIYEGGGKVCLIMECCTGGELYARLAERGVFSVPDAAEAMRQMLRAVGYLHSRNVVHRDLKLENFLYESEEDGAELKLIDFGFAKVWNNPSRLMFSPCGSISYVSPDILSAQGYTNKCDIWSLGVIIWMLLSGYPPFHGEDDKEIMTKIKAGEPDWSHKTRWRGVPQEATNFVKKLLEKDPLVRPSAEEASQHPWLESGLPDESVSECAAAECGALAAVQRSRPSLAGA